MFSVKFGNFYVLFFTEHRSLPLPVNNRFNQCVNLAVLNALIIITGVIFRAEPYQTQETERFAKINND